MCLECGCGNVGEVNIGGVPSRQVRSRLVEGSSDTDDRSRPSASASARTQPPLAHDDHEHPHDHGHEHHHASHTVEVNQAILAKNDRLAERNRGYFKAKGLLVLNMVSAPGSGKTTFIEKTAVALNGRLRTGVIVGDLATDNDAARLRAAGVPVVQITTGTVCHLEAEMVARAMGQLDLGALDLLVIENVGNLVCPAVYDLGEDVRVVLLSATEGEDKPLKYPPMFHSAHVAVITKSDLASAAEFNREKALANLHRISHHATIFEVSARTGDGMAAWCDFLLAKHKAARE